jgi:hypothetical protein
MLTTTTPAPTTDVFPASTEWGVRYTWTDGHTEVQERHTRLSAETGAEVYHRPDRTAEAVYRIGQDSSWQALPALKPRSTSKPLSDTSRPTVLSMILSAAGAVGEFFIAAALGGLFVYLRLKGVL